ncbi:alcohol dehydrogenase GroES domain protein (plasmid) [Streptantibioticus cattleyicolor NRRL 8057 = DSM 46488]|uniref:Alcohol dehydrogenase GroES domain protein n=1 Tax=Streptantibioticus cattleyicolor (strain ATCC 35852 / DSM 46488 / JCM 4925 / NBRC 14057 / NRRL 8057) TaxID=1003195 RepID=F8JKI9_STREN|nr:alcohol dehydrogenase GroES domain protein [Streptantibioticus cattleyicolor NRRL 8057 = DSM 46488]CCB71218.1 Zn-dependent oxidoreductase, NADPH:quinone reductase [Streptantibioticus cattleyicolor NRRL 8057 = DSM 46488]
MVMDSYGTPDVLRVADLPDPRAGAGQVRVRIKAAGLNPIDAKIRRGEFDAVYDISFPGQLGNEFAGVVDQAGAGTGFSAGDEVIGFVDMAAYAEYVVVPAENLTRKPKELGWETAAAIGAVGQAAFNALRTLGVTAGETLLVHGAAGGVGGVVTQLARARGVMVIGTARADHHDHVRSLGGIPVHHDERLEQRVREAAPDGVDAALDLTGSEGAITVSIAVTRDKSRIVTLAAPQLARQYGITMMFGTRSAETVARVAESAARGELHLPVARRFPLSQAAEAHRALEAGGRLGKLVLTLD